MFRTALTTTLRIQNDAPPAAYRQTTACKHVLTRVDKCTLYRMIAQENDHKPTQVELWCAAHLSAPQRLEGGLVQVPLLVLKSTGVNTLHMYSPYPSQFDKCPYLLAPQRLEGGLVQVLLLFLRCRTVSAFGMHILHTRQPLTLITATHRSAFCCSSCRIPVVLTRVS